jgi:hypothetical protein
MPQAEVPPKAQNEKNDNNREEYGNADNDGHKDFCYIGLLPGPEKLSQRLQTVLLNLSA